MAELLYINATDPDSTKYSIKFLRGSTIVVTKELLKSRNVPEMGSIQIF